MRTRIKGIHRVKSKGKVYYYHRATGTRLFSEPGTPEFFEELTKVAHESARKQVGKFDGLITQYLASAEYGAKSDTTKQIYSANLNAIRAKYGHFKVNGMNSPKAKRSFYEFRDKMADKPSRADSVMGTLKTVLSWAKKRGLIEVNQAEGIEKIAPKSGRHEKVWTPENIKTFENHKDMPEYLIHLLHLGLLTGQRLGDICAFRWSDIQDGVWKCTQIKTKKTVFIPIYADLQTRLAAIPKKGPFVLTDERGMKLNSKTTTSKFGRWRERAGVKGLVFHDTRGTCAQKLAEAGCNTLEICSITGHSMTDATTLIDAYLSRSAKLSKAAVHRLEAKTGTEFVKQTVKPAK